MPLTPKQQAAYSEAGNWVRLSNSITWAMAAIFPSLAVTPLYFSLTTRVPKPLLVLFSVAVAVFWIYVEYLYEKGSTHARDTLAKIESASGFGPHDFYTQQARLVPRIFIMIILYLIFCAGLALAWLMTWDWAPVAPILPN